MQNVQKYINEIVKYADPETKTGLKLSSLFEEGTIHVKLVINVDGVQVRESSDCSAYPLWVALADLPPKLRSSFDNIFLCSLWYGKGEISCDPIFDHYASEISKVEKIKYNERSYQIRFTTIFLIVDLVCKHDVLKTWLDYLRAESLTKEREEKRRIQKLTPWVSKDARKFSTLF